MGISSFQKIIHLFNYNGRFWESPLHTSTKTGFSFVWITTPQKLAGGGTPKISAAIVVPTPHLIRSL
jgi:hypothetical protein